MFILNNKIAFMADPTMDKKDRIDSKESAQRFFVNDCMPFIEIVEFNDGTQEEISRKGVNMQVSSTRRKKPSSKLMPLYFNGLINLNYKYVILASKDIDQIEMSKLQPYGKDEKGNTQYVCSVFYRQSSIGTSPEGRMFSEVTKVRIICYVHEGCAFDRRAGEVLPEFKVSFGDVNVISTEKLWIK